ncbi:MAG: hypothetical protein ACFFCM_11580 [Promethearchaeota archaeon]
MAEIKAIIDDLGIEAFENSIKIAAIAVLSDLGKIIYQTENWDLTNQEKIILDVIKGAQHFIISNVEYSVVEATTEGIIGINDSGMGHIIFAPFQGGVLLAYAMPQVDPPKALAFLKTFTSKLKGKV